MNRIKEKFKESRLFLDDFGKRISENHLIVFDYKSLLLILSIVLMLFFLTLFKIHGSSMSQWNDYVKEKSAQGTSNQGEIFGKPKKIRGDEWMIQTPFILSQLNQERPFSIKNDALGAGQAPLLMGLPTKHFSHIFRPQTWGFFVLDQERAFSFFWNFKAASLLVGFFLLLMLVTRNNFLISSFGSIWLLFSSFVQWWFTALVPDMIAAASFIFVSFVYLVASRRRGHMIFAAMALAFSLTWFALMLYPPFQVPLAYLLAFLAMGYFADNFSSEEFNDYWKSRLALLVAVLIIVSASLFAFYSDAKDTISIMQNTAYPGQRFSLGGDMDVARYFSGFYSFFLSEKQVPGMWWNICEASSFFFLFPLALLLMAKRFLVRKKYEFFSLAIIVYLLIVSAWMFVGFIPWLAKYSLFGMTIPIRTLIGLGVANIILVAYVLSREENEKFLESKLFNYVSLFFVAVVSVLYGLYLRSVTDNFFAYWQIASVSALLVLIAYLFLTKKKEWLFALMAGLFLATNFSVNPIAYGLSPIFEKEAFSAIEVIHKNDPSGKWIIYGNQVLAGYVKATGVDVFNGVKYTPNMEELRTLDPEEKYKDIYNRYAQIIVKEGNDDQGSEDVRFTLLSADTYEIKASPCAEKWRKLGIKYFVFTYEPDTTSTVCLQKLTDKPVNKLRLFVRKGE